jgi:hypothetical protein
MSRDLDPPVPPGEDVPDLPEAICWFVGACTSLRDLVLAFSEGPRRVAWKPKGMEAS